MTTSALLLTCGDAKLAALVEQELNAHRPQTHTFTNRHEIKKRLAARAGNSALPAGEVVNVRLDDEWDK